LSDVVLKILLACNVCELFDLKVNSEPTLKQCLKPKQII